MRAKTASIVHEDPYKAGREVVAELIAELGQAPDLVLVFASSELDQARVLDGIWSRLPESARLIGCSSLAEIGTEDALSGSVTTMGFIFDRVEWELFRLESAAGETTDAGRELGQMIAPFEPKLVVVLPDGVVANSMKFVTGMQEVLGSSCPIIGGLASEHFQFDRTHQLFDREVLEGGAVALALRGPLQIATAAGSGFQPVGRTRIATEVIDDKQIKTLDGESALELYKAFLGEEVLDRPFIGLEYPLAIISNKGGDYMESDERSLVIRAVRQLDEDAGALICAGDVYEGAQIRLTRATKEDLIAAATQAVEQAKQVVPDPALCLFFNCGGRRVVLGSRHQEEVAAALASLGPEVPRVGFYTYGEIAPIDDTNMYHDETFTLALLGTT